MRTSTVLALLGALAAVATTLPPADAAPVTLRLSGSVTAAEAANPFDIRGGELISGRVSFDSGSLSGSGSEFLSSEDDATLRLEISIGDFAFNEHDDIGFGAFPVFEFLDGAITDIDFIAPVDRVSRFVIMDQDGGERTFSFEVQVPGEDNRLVVTGTFDFVEDVGPLEVPEPATLTLLGIGLAGIGLARRRRA